MCNITCIIAYNSLLRDKSLLNEPNTYVSTKLKEISFDVNLF